MSRKVSYVKLLKEAMSDFDTSKSVDVKGPMVDSILSYKGDGELPTHKDAASILERYYFNENNDAGVKVDDPIDNPVDDVPDKNVQKTKKEIEKAVTEAEDKKDLEKAVSDEDDEGSDDDDELEIEVEESENIAETENAIIEKLIEEMEADILDENAEGKATEGEGTKAAGAGDAEDMIPDRKDGVDVTGESEMFSDLRNDIMNDLNEGGLGPIPIDSREEDQIEEAFAMFKEQLED